MSAVGTNFVVTIFESLPLEGGGSAVGAGGGDSPARMAVPGDHPHPTSPLKGEGTMATGCGTVQAKESEPPYRHRPLVRMKDLPVAGRPRERMLDRGAACLTEAELVAVLLGTGDARRSAVGLAQELLARFAESDDPTGLRGLLHAGPDALMEVPGMGEAKSARVIAALELGRRLAIAGPSERPTINGPDDAWRLLAPTLATLDREHFVALLVNSKHQVIGQVVVAIGTLNATLVHPRELFKEAIRKSAMGVLLAHNHPSGDPTPSPEDRALTHQLMAAGEILGMKVLDHLIIGDGRYVSLRQASTLWTEQPFHQ